MPRRRTPMPREMMARRQREAFRDWEWEPVSQVGPGGYGYPDGYHGAYAEREEYRMPRGRRRGPGWEYGDGPREAIHAMDSGSEERHRRAFADRELAREVDFALYDVIGRMADGIAVLADDAVITLQGVVPDEEAADAALRTAWETPGVHRVRDRLRVAGW